MNRHIGKTPAMSRHPKVSPKSNDREVGLFMPKYSFEIKKNCRGLFSRRRRLYIFS